ncbi:MAG: hypothetical protein R3C24_14625 [Cyanobacteriota/Melainabacteria group bacterium]
MGSRSANTEINSPGERKSGEASGSVEDNVRDKLFLDSVGSKPDRTVVLSSGLSSFEVAADEPSDDAELSRPSSYEYQAPPGQYTSRGGENLDKIAEKQLPAFLGDSYKDLAADKVNFKAFVQAYRNALAYINKLPVDAAISEGQKLTTPGRSPDGAAIYIENGKTRLWVGDSVETISADGTRRTDWENGTYSLTRPDGVNISKDVYGIVSTSRQEENGWWSITRSDGSYRRSKNDSGEEDSLDSRGYRYVKDKEKATLTAPDGTVHIDFNDGRKRDIEVDGSRTDTDRDGSSEIFDKSGKQIGSGLDSGNYKIFPSEVVGARVSRVESRTRPDFNFTLTEYGGSKGKVELKVEDPQKQTEKSEKSEKTLTFLDGKESEGLAEPRQFLIEKMEGSGMPSIVMAKFKADMIRFENRAKERKLPAEKIADCYKALGVMLGKQDSAPVDENRRYQLAAQTMSNLAQPYSISQGFHNTCNVKVLDVVINAKHPDVAANMISEVALTGSYTLPSGATVEVPKGALSPVGNAAKVPTPDGNRSFAGQIFDAVAVNSLLQNQNLFYRFEPMPFDSELKGYKTGDIMVKNDTNKPILDKETGEVQEFSGLSTENIARVYRLIMGDAAASRDWLLDPRASSDISDGVKTYSSEGEFRQILTDLKKQGAFPFPMHVNTKMAPFWKDSGGGSAGGSSEGAHVVNITDFDPETGRVEIDNQWSSRDDRNTVESSVPISQLYYSSLGKYQMLTQISQQVADRVPQGDTNAETLTTLSRFSELMKGSDPAYLAADYNFLSLKFGRILRGTEAGSPENTALMKQFRDLRPSGKLACLQALVQEGEVGGMKTGDFYRNVLELSDHFGFSQADLTRGLDKRPQNADEAKAANIRGGFFEDPVYLQAKIEMIRLFGDLSPGHRRQLTEMLTVQEEKKLAESREFSRLTVE